jgi:UDP-N-acetylmuramoyl-tripeptide--D-alanyl-D-alanine ligase
MQAHFTTNDIISIFGKQNLPPEWECRGVSTDTRAIQPGQLFVALRGEQFDGHNFLLQAIEKGAVGVLVASDADVSTLSVPAIKVDDTLVGLGALGEYHRRRFSLPVIAIAGAAGKTTTKEMTAHICRSVAPTLATQGNLNNRIGVPLTLLQLTAEHQFAVIEIGTNEPGEIEVLAQMVAPTHGIITNIGKEHLEKLGDMDGVEREETALFRYLQAHHGIALINTDDERLEKYLHTTDLETVGYGTRHKNNTVQGKISYDDEGNVILAVQVVCERGAAYLQCVGYVSGFNALAAIALSLQVGISLQTALISISSYIPTTAAGGYGRMVVEKLDGGITLLNDCYNANPTSMYTALNTLAELPSQGKKIAVLGDMFELGGSSLEEHYALLKKIIDIEDIHEVIIIGENMTKAYNTLASGGKDKIILAYAPESITTLLHKALKQGDVILVKGSRGMKMERIVAGLYSETPRRI